MSQIQRIVNEEENNEQETEVPDLELQDEQAKEVQGGPAFSPTFQGGIFVASGD